MADDPVVADLMKRIAASEAAAAASEAAAAASKTEAEQAAQKLAAAQETIANLSAKLGVASIDPNPFPAGGGEGHSTLTFPRFSVMSPSTSASSFLNNSFVGLIAAPVTMVVHPSLGATFKGLLKAATTVWGLSEEARFYALATSHLPSFAERVGSPGGDMSAVSLFSTSALGTPVWSLPSSSKPELHVRAAVGEGPGVGGTARPAHCPAFNGELKSATNNRALDQAVLYTTLDMVRVFFPAPATPASSRGASGAAAADASATAAASKRLFYTHPPLGFALVGYPHVAYLLALEWVGKLLVSPASLPFFLGSPQHAEAVAALPDQRYEPPEVLDLTIVQPWLTLARGDEKKELCAWCVHGGTFRKLVRGDARTGEGFAGMYAAYAALARLLPGAPPTLNLPPSVRLLFGVHEVLVEMPAVQGRAAREEELVGDLLSTVATAVAWLACQGVVYTDVRAPNVMVDGAGKGWLVDFDDCLVVPAPVTSLECYRAAVMASPAASQLNTFAASLGSGKESALEEALKSAFSEAASAGWV